MTGRTLVFRLHAIDRMGERGITIAGVQMALTMSEVIEEYPDETPYPGRLVLGWLGPRALHIVAADSTDEPVTYIITVYFPDPMLWEPDLRTRKS